MPSAADVVNTLDQQALASILAAYGEERWAGKIASAIVEARRISPITRTQQLASVVAGSSTLCCFFFLQAEKGGGGMQHEWAWKGRLPSETYLSEKIAQNVDLGHNSSLCVGGSSPSFNTDRETRTSSSSSTLANSSHLVPPPSPISHNTPMHAPPDTNENTHT